MRLSNILKNRLFLAVFSIGFLLLNHTNLSGQEGNKPKKPLKRIKGRVIHSKTGDVIAYANIQNLSTSKGSVTQYDGTFTIRGREGDQIIATFQGLKDITFQIDDRPLDETYIVEMYDNPNTLDEVELDLVGSQTNITLPELQTGNVIAIDMDRYNLNATFNANVFQSLQGLDGSINVGQFSPDPFEETSIEIGSNVLDQLGETNGSPLIVLDGTPLPADDGNGFQSEDIVSAIIDNNNIETITLLIDDEATADWGEDGANGVILITTKAGSFNEKPSIRYSFGLNIQAFDGYPEDNTTAGEYYRIRDQEAINDGRDLFSITSGLFTEETATQENLDRLYTTNFGDDYSDILFGGSPVNLRHRLNITGGGSDYRYGLSFRNIDNNTISGNVTNDKNMSLNMSFSPFRNFDVTPRITFADRNRERRGGQNDSRTLLTSFLEKPGEVIYNPETGDLTDDDEFNRTNPALLGKNFTKIDIRTANVLVSTRYTMSEAVSLTGNIGYVSTNQTAQNFITPGVGLVLFDFNNEFFFFDPNNFGVRTTNSTNNQFSVRGGVQWLKKFNERKQLRLSYNVFFNTRSITTSRIFRDSEDEAILSNINSGRIIRATYINSTVRKNITNAVRARYSIGPFNLSGALSRSQVGSASLENQVLWRWAVGGTVNILEIPFLEKYFSKVFNTLSLSANTGLNNRQAAFLSDGSTTSRTYDEDNTALVVSAFENNFRRINRNFINIRPRFSFKNLPLNIRYNWQVTRNDNAEIRISDVIEDGGGARLSSGIDGPFGFRIGALRSVAHNFNIGMGNIISNPNFSLGMNMSFQLQKITFSDAQLKPNGEPYRQTVSVAGFYNQVISTEIDPGAIYGLKTDGLYQTEDEIDPIILAQNPNIRPGDVKYVDVNKDGFIDDRDNVTLGNALIPDVRGGLGFTMNFFGKIGVRLNFDYSIGLDRVRASSFIAGSNVSSGIPGRIGNSAIDPDNNRLASDINYWTPENTNTNIPRPTITNANWNNFLSDRQVYDASYIRLQTLGISYQIPSSIFDDKLAVGVNFIINNLFNINDFPGDPIAQTRIQAQQINSLVGRSFNLLSRIQPTSYGINLNVRFL